MSAKRQPADPETWVDAREPATDRPADPYGIVPEAFLQRYPDAETIAEALELAARAPTTTDPESLPRCPNCDSVKIARKDGHKAQPHRRPEAFKCNECREHFEEPATSINDRVGKQATFREVRRR